MNLKTWVYHFAKKLGMGYLKQHRMWGVMKKLIASTECNGERWQCIAILIASEIKYGQKAFEKEAEYADTLAQVIGDLDGIEPAFDQISKTVHELLDNRLSIGYRYDAPEKEPPFGTYGGGDL